MTEFGTLTWVCWIQNTTLVRIPMDELKGTYILRTLMCARQIYLVSKNIQDIEEHPPAEDEWVKLGLQPKEDAKEKEQGMFGVWKFGVVDECKKVDLETEWHRSSEKPTFGYG